MNKKWVRVKVLIFSMTVLSLTLSLILSKTSYAECVRKNVQFLPLTENKAMIYWEERDCPYNTRRVYYQSSVDGLKSWSAPKRLVSFEDRSVVKTYEPPIMGGTTILTAVAIESIPGQAKIYVKTSKDAAATWTQLRLVKSFSGSFNDCPILDLQYEPKLALFILTTVIKEANGIYAYIISSPDGINWVVSNRLGRDNFPAGCEDD